MNMLQISYVARNPRWRWFVRWEMPEAAIIDKEQGMACGEVNQVAKE